MILQVTNRNGNVRKQGNQPSSVSTCRNSLSIAATLIAAVGTGTAIGLLLKEYWTIVRALPSLKILLPSLKMISSPLEE